jgi:Zn-dependent protease
MTALSSLFSLETVLSLFALLFAITVHEASHAWTAMKFGDPTAQAMGRVSLNPLAHIDPFGTVLLPLMLRLMGAPAFGWAKPVMINPRNLRHPRRDNLWISFAGPAANISVAAVSLVLMLLVKAVSPRAMVFLAAFLGQHQLTTGFGPLEGLVLVLFYFVLVNTYLAVFNLIPVPPLDGSGVLSGLSSKAAAVYDTVRPYSFFIGLFVIVALIRLGILDRIVGPIFSLIGKLLFTF